MKNELLTFLAILFAVIIGGAAEELLPKFAGVGVPVLLSICLVGATGKSVFASGVLALASGVFEDALCGLPFFLSASYFLAGAALMRFGGVSRALAVLVYPCYQLWLAVWLKGLSGGIWGRLIVSVPIGCATFCVVWAASTVFTRRYLIDEA